MSMTLVELAHERGLSLHRARSADEQAEQMARMVLDAVRDALDQRGQATLAVSGGRSPAAFFERLEKAELPWEKVTLTLADERWVPPTHPDSNAGLVQRCMPSVFSRVRWISLYRGDDPQADAVAVSADLARALPLDVLVLGVGSDGHTASLFPGEEALTDNLGEAASALCIAVPADGQRLPRLTLTGAVLQRARVRLLQLNGEDKRRVVVRAFQEDPEQLPIAAFLHSPLDIFDAP